jgi:phosphoribosylanthranilate isomerase
MPAGVKTRVKICGVRDRATVDAAAGADALGFMFVEKSPRHLPPHAAAPLIAAARPLAVGVFADADDPLLAAGVAAGIGAIQLHGSESPERVADVRARFGLPVWRAVGVRTAADVRAASAAYPMADRLLLDAKAPEGADRTGGHGVRFDWRILAEARPARPWVLAGGLAPETVAEAIAATGADYVDVSSGVEDAGGAKSLAKIAAFLERARRG